MRRPASPVLKLSRKQTRSNTKRQDTKGKQDQSAAWVRLQGHRPRGAAGSSQVCRVYLTPGPPSAGIAVGTGAGAPAAHPEGRLSSGLGNPRPWSLQRQPRPVAGPGSCRGSGQGGDLRLPGSLTGGWSLCGSSQETVNSELGAGVLEGTGCLSEHSPDPRQWIPGHSRPVPRHFPLWSQHCFLGPRRHPLYPSIFAQ